MIGTRTTTDEVTHVRELCEEIMRSTEALSRRGSNADQAADLSHHVRRRLDGITLRRNFLPEEACREPVWSTLLYLLTCSLEGKPNVSQTKLLEVIKRPQSSTSRRLANLEQSGLIACESDENDVRKVLVRLTPEGQDMLTAYFQEEMKL